MKKSVFTKILAVLCAVMCLVPLCAGTVFAAAGEAAETASSGGIHIDFGRALEKLVWMVEGMLCIIVVIGVLIIVTMILNKVTAAKKK